VGGLTSAATSADQFTYAATPTTLPVAVPRLTKGYGFWVSVTSGASGPVSATWQLSQKLQGTLAIYAGNPFAGGADPVRRTPPAGALVTKSAKASAFSITAGVRPPGVYTVYFYAGTTIPASTGSVTSWR
jgi:hypothetical protein